MLRPGKNQKVGQLGDFRSFDCQSFHPTVSKRTKTQPWKHPAEATVTYGKFMSLIRSLHKSSRPAFSSKTTLPSLPAQSSYSPAAVSGMLMSSCLAPLPIPPRRVGFGVKPLVNTTGSSGGRKHATALSGSKVIAKTSCSSTWAGQVLC